MHATFDMGVAMLKKAMGETASDNSDGVVGLLKDMQKECEESRESNNTWREIRIIWGE